MGDTKDNFEKFTLPNGLTVLLYKMKDVRSVSAILYVQTGAVFEPESERGVSHLLEHSILIGTRKYPTAEIISKTAENFGIYYNGNTSRDSTFYPVKSPYMNFDKGLELLSQFIFAPLFVESEVLKEKAIVLSEYGDFWNNPERKFDHEVWRKRFSQEEHPYSWRPMGKPETINKLNLKMVLDWHKKYYNPSNMVLSIAGNFESKNVIDMVTKLFGQEKKGIKYDEPKFNTDDYSSFRIYDQQDKRTQISFQVSFPAFGFREVDRVERVRFTLLNVIFGSTHSSRLYTRLRLKEKFVYNMFSEKRLLPWMGALTVRASTPIKNLTPSLKAIKEEIDNLLENGLKSEEIALAKNYLTAQTLLYFDNPAEIAGYFGNEALYEDDITFPEERIKIIKSITKSDLESLAKRIFDYSRVNIGVLGDVSPSVLKEIETIFKR